MGLARTLEATAEGERAWQEKLGQGMARRNSKSDIKSVVGWEDQPSMDDWKKRGIVFTNKGINFAPGVTQEDYKSLGGFCGLLNNSSKLWVGDWAAYGQLRWNYTRNDLAEMSGLDVETVDNYLSVGRRVPAVNRVAGLTPRHYAAVSNLDRATQGKLLKIAGRNGWSSDMVRNKKKAVQEYGQPLDDTPIFRGDLDALKEAKEAADAAELAARTGVVLVTRELRHEESYTLALLRDSTESLPELFEVPAIEQPNMEIEITLVGNYAHLLALLAAELPDELEIGIRINEVVTK